MSSVVMQYISDPFTVRAETLLHAIESTPTAFSTGRRNDDVVNWFLIKRLLEIQAGQGYAAALYRYQAMFDVMLEVRRNAGLKDSLHVWDMPANEKIRRLHEHYARVDTEAEIGRLWLPQDYQLA